VALLEQELELLVAVVAVVVALQQMVQTLLEL
jgi:hypothetical protein